jgi:putative membrane protein
MTLDSRSLAALLPIVLAGALAVGCGDDDDKNGTSMSPSESADGSVRDSGPSAPRSDGGAGSADGGGGGSVDAAARDGGTSVAEDASAGGNGNIDSGIDVDAGGGALDGGPVSADGAVVGAQPDATSGGNGEPLDGGTPTTQTDAGSAPTDARPPIDPSVLDATLLDGRVAPPFDNDAVVGFVQAANQHEITAGELAVTRAQNPQVRAYAADMIAMHAPAKDTLADFALAQGIVEGDSRDEDLFRENQLQKGRELAAAPDAQFDALYVESQVLAHGELLSMIDAVLLPSATGALRAQLEATRPMIVDHLSRAMTLRAALAAPTP